LACRSEEKGRSVVVNLWRRGSHRKLKSEGGGGVVGFLNVSAGKKRKKAVFGEAFWDEG